VREGADVKEQTEEARMDSMRPSSPLPWKLDEIGLVITDDARRSVVAGTGDGDVSDEDAAYIVRAANAFPELLAALKAIVKADEAKSLAAIVEAMPAARAAITKAEEP
jgi:hypothetical protein